MLESRPERPVSSGSDEESTMRHQIAVMLLIPLVVLTTSVLMLFRQVLEPVDTIGAPASAEIGAVRAYVSDLNAFLQGGTMEALMRNYDEHASVRIHGGSDALARD